MSRPLFLYLIVGRNPVQINFGTACLRIEPSHSTQCLFSPQNTIGVLLLWSGIVWHAENQIWWLFGFPPFLAPLVLFFQKSAKTGYLANYCSVLPHFCCNDFLYCNVDYLYEKDTNRVSWWWDLARQIGGEMLGSRRGQLDTCTPIGSFKAQVLSHLGAKLKNCKLGCAYSGNISKIPPFQSSVPPLIYHPHSAGFPRQLPLVWHPFLLTLSFSNISYTWWCDPLC